MATRETHEWVAADRLIKWPYCRKCLVIQRADGKNRPCKGRAKLALRGEYQPQEPTHD